MGVSLRWFGGVLMIVGSVGCSQSGMGSLNSPTAPSSLSGSFALSSESGEFTTLAGPGASYDASGSWNLVISERPNGDGFPVGDVDLTHHSDGTITFSDDTALFTFTPRGQGTGRIIPYDLSAFGPAVLPNSPCETRISGTAILDTEADTITVSHFSGVEDDCENVSGSAKLTRN